MLSTTSTKHKLAAAGIAVAGSLAIASSAAAAGGCGTPNPLAFTLPFSYSCTPAWNDHMQGGTASVTVSGTGTVTLLSFKTQPQLFEGDLRVLTSFPQEGYDVDQVTLKAGEPKTLTVDVPSCYYQLDVVNGDPDAAVKSIGVPSSTAGQFSESAPMVAAILGGKDKCTFSPPPTPNPDPENPPTPDPQPDPNTPPNPYKPPVLPPVPDSQVVAAGNTTPKAIVSACAAFNNATVKVSSYRPRAGQRNTISVRVTSKSTTKPKVTLKGAGVSTSKRVGSKNTAVFRVKPSRAGSIKVSASVSGCKKSGKAVKVLSAKRSQSRGVAPTFTG